VCWLSIFAARSPRHSIADGGTDWLYCRLDANRNYLSESRSRS
jgi:hypothetical protein